ncbi:NHLP leader peptide domain-containing protein [Pseudovibrio denitrificans]|uniref:NHLP leader peptide domain-containing protein n=1 Tax=Pseudovibrio denitrificans TaxID=258256 RepID=A0A1I7DYU1_9HYPH|nr:NHLP leader peptide family RiPP precursor [Pseudovibrio denitrificans]SFU16786.1 NHLP leader peptide domain-containing protein [Pseudovibrio denitrificans]
MSSELQERKFWDGYSALVKKAWQDEDFKQRLLADPEGVFNEHNLKVPDGMKVRIMEDKANLRHLPLPPKPTLEEKPSEKEMVTAGSWFCCHTWGSEETSHG